MADVTAIIVTYNSAPPLPGCLDALKAAGIPALVVDNISSDTTVALAEHLGATVIRSPANEGYGRGNNRGAQAATSAYILILNPDANVNNDTVPLLLAALDKNPQAGLAAPQLIEPDGRIFRTRVEDGIIGPFVSGACMLIKRDLFLSLGGFDPNIFLYFEDDDLCRRLTDTGRPPLFVPQARVHHIRGAGSVATLTMPNAKPSITRWHAAWSRFYVMDKYRLPWQRFTLASWLLRFGLKWLLAKTFGDLQHQSRYAGSFLGACAWLRGTTAMQFQKVI